MAADQNSGGHCVCGFGEEFFTMEGGVPICTVCGGIVGKGLDDFFEPEEKSTGKTVLIVDDQAFFRERLGLILKKHGHEVIEAADGLGAVKVVAEMLLRGQASLSTAIDAVVLDLVMPGDLDGFQTLAVIKTITKDIPVIVLTATPPKKDLLQKLARLGAKKYLNKSAGDLDDLVSKNIRDL